MIRSPGTGAPMAGPGPVAALVVIVLLAAGCVAPDQETVSLGGSDRAEQTLPSVTATVPPTATSSPTPGAEPDGDGSTGSAAPSTTTTAAPLQGLRAELVASGFDQPVLVTSAPGTDALFVVEREGIIRLVEQGPSEQGPDEPDPDVQGPGEQGPGPTGSVADEPFLDLTDRLLSNSIEQGLLGLAFHPDFATNSIFFAYWTDPDGDSHLARFRAPTPTRADPDSLETVLQIDQPAERHNAGMLQFGPDGLLYLALGDGGSGGGPAQDTSDLLGSILRLDVDRADPYAIPAGNPFANEIWVYGLRNPWRFSIDPVTELMYIGDVGQDRWEEVNVVALDGAGTNFGWRAMEGDTCFEAGCQTDGLTTPILQYSHDDGCSITGGSVYRGPAIPELVGHYFFADWCGGLIRSFRYNSRGQVVDSLDWTDQLAPLGQVTSFGTDGDGEMYAVNWAGELHRIVAVR